MEDGGSACGDGDEVVSVAGMGGGFGGVSEDGGLASCGVKDAGEATDAGPEGTDDDEDLWFHGRK